MWCRGEMESAALRDRTRRSKNLARDLLSSVLMLPSKVRSALRGTRWRTVTALAVAAAVTAFVCCGVRRRSPGPNAPLDDLSVSAEEILRDSPDVADVEILVKGFWPNHRIIQINDRHYITREKFGSIVDIIGHARGHAFTEQGAHDWHQAVADDVERFQVSQTRLLCWLADHHGLREIFQEGVFAENVPTVIERVALFRRLAAHGDQLKHEIKQLREDIRGDRTPAASPERQKLLEEARDIYLHAGAVGALLAARPSLVLLPAEDKDVFENALPEVQPRLYGPHFDARNAEIVRRLLAHGPCAVVVLGAAHDLSHEVRAQGWGRCEYIRVTVENVPRPLRRYGLD